MYRLKRKGSGTHFLSEKRPTFPNLDTFPPGASPFFLFVALHMYNVSIYLSIHPTHEQRERDSLIVLNDAIILVGWMSR